MTYVFHPDAENEFNIAVDYYEHIETGLGYDFALEVYSAIQRILQLPYAWPELDGDIRRSLVHRFPYGVLYSVGDQEIFIIAIMNLHKEPDYWKKIK